MKLKNVITTPERWATAVEFLLTQEKLTFDTEFIAYGTPDNVLVGFSFSWPVGEGEWKGLYVPLQHKDPATRERYDWQLTPEQIAPGLKSVLENDKVQLGGQNFKVEIQSVAPLGIYPTENVFDTMLVGYLLSTNGYGPPFLVEQGKGKLGLKDMSAWVLGEKQKKLKELNFPKEYDERLDKNTLFRVDLVDDLQLFADYAIGDTNQTGKLWDEFSRRLAREPTLEQIYYRIHREFMFVLADMELFGTELDTVPLAEMRTRIEAELKKITEEIYVARRWGDFSPLKNPTAAKKAAKEYDLIEAAREKDDKHSPYFPRDAKDMPNTNAVGGWRKKMFDRHGLLGHPVVEKIKDEKLRPWIISHPHLAHKVFKLGGDKDLAQVFFTEEELPMLGGKFGKAKESTAAGVVKVWAKEHDNAMAKLLLKYRMREKLLSTYLIGLPRMLAKSDGRLHGRFNQTGARTGRLSSAEPNLQNQPKTTKYPIRRSYVASGVSESKVEALEWQYDDGEPTRIIHATVEGRMGGYEVKNGKIVDYYGKQPPMVMFVGDYSQLEIRILAHMSQDAVLMDAILNDVDTHSLTARGIFDEVPDDTELDQVKVLYKKFRDRGKTANFGVIYGMGAHKFARDYGYSIEEATYIIEERWMGLYAGVAAWIAEQHGQAEKYGEVQTLIGQKRHLPAARYVPYWPCSKRDLLNMEKRVEETLKEEKPDVKLIAQYEALKKEYDRAKEQFILKNKAFRQAQNAPIQGTASNIVSIAQRDIRRWAKKEDLWGRYEGMRMLLQVHDEVVSEIHPSIANEVMERQVELMEGVFTLSVPLGVSAALGHSWLDAKD